MERQTSTNKKYPRANKFTKYVLKTRMKENKERTSSIELIHYSLSSLSMHGMHDNRYKIINGASAAPFRLF
jgi:hypothetical protein